MYSAQNGTIILFYDLYDCFREKKQKIQDIKNNIKEAIEVCGHVKVIFVCVCVCQLKCTMSLTWGLIELLIPMNRQ